MLGNPELERRLLEQTYEDTMTVSRSLEVEADNLTSHRWTDVEDGVSCALSFGGGDKSVQTSGENKIEYDATVFASPGVDVQVGDRLTVLHLQVSYSLEVVGRPLRYPSHLEIRVRERGLG